MELRSRDLDSQEPDDSRTGRPAPPTAVDRLQGVVDELTTAVPADLPGMVALAEARALMGLSQRLDAEVLRRLSDVEARQLFTHEGAPTITTWVAGQRVAGLDRQQVVLARRLARVPLVAERLGAGELSVRAAALLARAVHRARPFLDRADGRIDGQDGEPVLHGVLVDGVLTVLSQQVGGLASVEQAGRWREELETLAGGPGSQLARWEAGLVWLTGRLAPELLPGALGLLVDALLPAEHDRRAALKEQQAGVELVKNDGPGWRLRGELDDATGELLFTVLSAQSVTDPANEPDAAAYAAADLVDPDLTGDLVPPDWPSRLARPRSRRQRQHDALRRGLRHLLDSGALGSRAKVAPHLAVTVSLDAVHGVPGALPGRAGSGARWSRAQVRRVLCESSFTRLVLDARARVLEVSHEQRTLKAYERLILRVESGGVCATAGCTRGSATGDPLVPHHPELYAVTGVTRRDDTVPLCAADHHQLHQNHRTLRLKDGRWLGPDGWTTRPGGSLQPG